MYFYSTLPCRVIVGPQILFLTNSVDPPPNSKVVLEKYSNVYHQLVTLAIFGWHLI